MIFSSHTAKIVVILSCPLAHPFSVPGQGGGTRTFTSRNASRLHLASMWMLPEGAQFRFSREVAGVMHFKLHNMQQVG